MEIDDAHLERIAGCLKALASTPRLQIVCLLSESELCVNDIWARTGGSQPNVSQHLTLLMDKGVLGSRREANRIYYFIRSDEMIRLVESLRAVFC